eukprot:3151251-Alexandrium_andersonii.AAC.1
MHADGSDSLVRGRAFPGRLLRHVGSGALSAFRCAASVACSRGCCVRGLVQNVCPAQTAVLI